jgi:cell division protein FtsL
MKALFVLVVILPFIYTQTDSATEIKVTELEGRVSELESSIENIQQYVQIVALCTVYAHDVGWS